jgi:hypothetical protein
MRLVWWGLAIAIGLAAFCLVSPVPIGRPSDKAAVPPAKPARNAISDWNESIERGAITPAFEPTAGYLRSVLEFLKIPLESQIAVFASDSFQAKLVNQENPRAIYFNDDVAVAWVRGSSSIEAAALDPGRGIAFYTLENRGEKPRFRQNDSCLLCHQSKRTLGVPGLFVLSIPPDRESGGQVSDHRTPFTKRWGGWFVTGLSIGFRHLGNRPGQGWLRSLYDQFDRSGYLTDYSDIVALMTFEHQTQAANLINRLAWETRTGESGQRLQDAVDALVDYLLFVDEARPPSRIIGTSGFRKKFEALGPFDRKGRSLRQLDLQRRMMLYPCSYMIYSKAFEALPSGARESVYARMWDILAGRSEEQRYARMPRADRDAVIQILQDTKKDLPEYFTVPAMVKARS